MSNGTAPWKPGLIRDRDDIDGFLYVVVEEEIDDTIGLVVAEWPSGGHDAPRFHEESGEFEVAVDREALRRQLSDRQVPEPSDMAREEGPAIPPEVVPELQTRGIAVGDVFAIRPTNDFSPDADPEWLRSCEWIGEAIDVTAEAREAAKASMYEALTPPLDPALAEELLAESEPATEPGEFA
ncbi:MAG TPA: hypothetical protein VID51_00595 [Solirubrobacterales bacterium]|jgi:hypothetical protein